MSERDQPVLDQVNIVVRDMDGMSAFYRLLGLPLDSSSFHQSAPAGQRMTLDLDASHFAAVWNEGWTEAATGVVLGFRLATREGVDRVYRELTAAGHRSQQRPYDAFWGSRYAVVIDPEGNTVGLMSPRDDSMRSVPPEPYRA